MKVGELIEALGKLDPETEVKHVFESAIYSALSRLTPDMAAQSAFYCDLELKDIERHIGDGMMELRAKHE